MAAILDFAAGVTARSASVGRTMVGGPTAAQDMAGQSRAPGILSSLKRLLAAYFAWRIEREVIAQLAAMSDRELKDIGLTRSQIPGAVRSGGGSNSAFNRSA